MSSSPGPLVSVVLASRNGERYLAESLASLAAQTWPHVELLLVDDGSTDSTGPLLERFAAVHPNARVFHAAGVGAAAARALALAGARGEFLTLQDDDDRSHPERLERQVRHLLAHPGIQLLGTAAETIDEEGAVVAGYPVPLGQDAIARTLRRAPAFVHGSVMMRRDAYRAAGGYRAPFRAAEDYDLYLRMPAGAGLANLPEPLYAWRRHAGNSFARARNDHLFFLAVARAFRDERAATGRDSIEALAGAQSPEAFLDAYRFPGRLLFYLGEAYTREGRVAEARRYLRRSIPHRDTRTAALGWWALSFGMGLARRARGALPPLARPSS
jgi:glycosyltransferase involved in cell wall biosynthesis